MKKLLFGIFAHPDDEGFGPSGTLIKEVAAGVDVHLMCVTDGGAGQNVDNHDDLASRRRNEWQAAAKLIGAKSTTWLGYHDGQLNNNLYHEIADKIFDNIEAIVSDYNEPVELNFMTFDTTGLSGHIDHIAVSLITSYIYATLAVRSETSLGNLRYFCIPYDPERAHSTNYLYAPPGRKEEEIDQKIDVSDVFDKKLTVMRTHHTQRDDMDWIIKTSGDSLKTENFRNLKL